MYESKTLVDLCPEKFTTKLNPPKLLQFISSESKFSKNLGATSKLYMSEV